MRKKEFLTSLIVLLLVFSAAFAEDQHTYYNYNYGYSFDYYGFNLDNSNETIKTNFYHNDSSIDIFYEDFTNSVHNAWGYINYSNKYFSNSQYVDVFFDIRKNIQGYDTHIVSWHRKDLLYLPDAYNYYTNIDIIKNNNEVYTIYIKSKNIIDYGEILSRFRITERDLSAPLNYKQYRRTVNPHWSQATSDFYYDDFSKKDYVEFGYFEPTSKDNMYRMGLYEKSIGHKVKYMLEYYDMSLLVPDGHLKKLNDDGRILEFTYQTSYHNVFDGDMLYKILDGKEDQSIERLAKILKEADGPILFRFNNEMNGDWCSYNALHYQRDTEIFVKAWQYLHDKIIAEGADNVIFVFNPNEASFPGFKWNHYTNYFPGSAYVDVIGVTGYNTGNYYPGETWRSFPEIYDKIMSDYQERFYNYDFYITEFGSSIFGGDREQWFAEMLDVINNYNFKVAIYWSGIDWDGKDTPARIYRIDGYTAITEQLKAYYAEQRAKFLLKEKLSNADRKE